jgi:type II secretory pathway pseudopilin PulG
MWTEMVVAVAVLGMVLVGLAVTLDGFGRFNHYQLVRQQCIAAAQAQLDSVTATGEAISQEDFERLWPRLSISTAKSAGVDQWNGMTLVEVTVTARSFNKDVRVTLSRYVSGSDISPANVIAEPAVAGEQ